MWHVPGRQQALSTSGKHLSLQREAAEHIPEEPVPRGWPAEVAGDQQGLLKGVVFANRT